ncbi:hypothetical protein COW53_05645 [bacterium CG17_big_fil_post_rev_8_21_14_2_50_64_8]|nr:MAG: hypothetical protein COW53_05645 [bacterium CG17_big_fil_post_rev_8_21_14_2_50_64_8]PJA74139.1 MAG: hypothetical protein CO151_10635 [bacterium CG_4_9_14_3_um_filter_65_15]
MLARFHAESSTKFAVQTIATVLRSLGDDDEDDSELNAIEADFEADMEWVEELTDKVEKHVDMIDELADELKDRISALDELDRFLDA